MSGKVPTMVRDPVYGMRIEAADAAETSGHNRRTVYSCAASCMEVFGAGPEKYRSGHRRKAPTVMEIGQIAGAASDETCAESSPPTGDSSTRIDIGAQTCVSALSIPEVCRQLVAWPLQLPNSPLGRAGVSFFAAVALFIC